MLSRAIYSWNSSAKRTDPKHAFFLKCSCEVVISISWLRQIPKRGKDLLLLGLLAWFWPQPIQAALIWEAGQTSLTASDEYAYYCEDQIPAEAADPARLRQELWQNQRGTLNLGYLRQRSCWTELQIELQDNNPRIVYLEYGMTQVDVMRVFLSQDGKIWSDLGTAGNNIPTQAWPVHYRTPTFELKLEPGLNTLRIFQSSRDITGMDWKIWDIKTFHAAVNWENILFGGFFAICIALSFYNLVIFFVSRDVLHLYYFLYLSTYGWVQMFLTGFTKLHLLTDAGPFLGRLGLSSICISIFCVYIFVGKFLEISSFPRLMSRAFWFMGAASLSNILLSALGPFDIAAQICLISSALGSIMALLYGVYALKQRHPMAPLFMLAWCLLLLGTVVQVLALYGLVDSNPATRSANFIGATVEALLISYALAIKMKRERLDETQRRQHAYSQLEKMVYPHQLSMMKQGRQLEETMPLAKGHAFVICVDMINSSKQNVDELKNFLRSFFDACDALMNRGYVDGKMHAFGFRIKEMGDGFLCSIGFPFAPPSTSSLPQIATDMALDFVEKFEETLLKYPFHGATEPLLSIGIAEGPIEGFFTLAGIRSYELFGKGIVLATRYEALRKIYPIPGQGHLICMKSTVYEALPASYQKQLVRYGLDRSQRFIRDDETVQDFYYQRLTSPWRKAASA